MFPRSDVPHSDALFFVVPHARCRSLCEQAVLDLPRQPSLSLTPPHGSDFPLPLSKLFSASLGVTCPAAGLLPSTRMLTSGLQSASHPTYSLDRAPGCTAPPPLRRGYSTRLVRNAKSGESNEPPKKQCCRFARCGTSESGLNVSDAAMRPRHAPDCRRPQNDLLGHCGTTHTKNKTQGPGGRAALRFRCVLSRLLASGIRARALPGGRKGAPVISKGRRKQLCEFGSFSRLVFRF